MTDMQKTIESLCEKVVLQMKDQGGSINTDNHLYLFDNNNDNRIRVGRMLVSHNLASTPNPNSFHLYTLTQKGWEFESFEAQRKEREFQKEFLKANYDTQESIRILNTKTDSFYKSQRNLTIIIAVSTAIYTIVASVTFFKSCSGKNSQLQQCKSTQLPSTIQSSKINMQLQQQNDSGKKQ